MGWDSDSDSGEQLLEDAERVRSSQSDDDNDDSSDSLGSGSTRGTVWWCRQLMAASKQVGKPSRLFTKLPVQRIVSGCAGCSAESAVLKASCQT